MKAVQAPATGQDHHTPVESGADSARASGCEDLFPINSLCQELEEYLGADEVAGIYQAYLFSAEAHGEQKRLSGEPYIHHPVEVAKTMAGLRLDAVTITAGLLHDVIEDTHVTKRTLKKKFGAEVAEVVDGVSKLQGLEFESKEVEQAGNFQKMMLAMAQDLRVILVKLADRLHNMRTIRYMPAAKQKIIARETLEIYVPLAQRLGMDKVRIELEDLGFKTLYPMRYAVLEKVLRERGGNRYAVVEKALSTLRSRLDHFGISYRIHWRRKHLYSVYRKMKEKRLSFSEISDIFAIRLVVPGVDDCYRMLGLVHGFYKPMPGRFKDYIAIPKANGYQSLHTVLFGPQGILIEVQIRTREMDEVAETGIAAHALYKVKDAGGSLAAVRTHEWLHSLLAIQQNAGDSIEFMENLKAELFPDEVYVFTPEGEIMALPRKATALDFAFAVHTDLGLSTSGARIDKRLSLFSQELKSGQTVEIITSPDARPAPGWLGFAVTVKARAAIRNYLKNIQGNEAERLGRQLLDEALKSASSSLREVKKSRLEEVMKIAGVNRKKKLFREIGMGNQAARLIAARLTGAAGEGKSIELKLDRSTAVKGTRGIVVTYARCCYPVPGDSIVGTMSPGRGLVVHRGDCRNATIGRTKDELILLQWADDPDADDEYSAAIRAETRHQKGVLAVIASKIAQLGSNIEHVAFDEGRADTAALTFIISVKNRGQLDKIMSRIANAVEGTRVYRIGPTT